MFDTIFMIMILFFSCIGIFSLGYYIQNNISLKQDQKKYFVVIPVDDVPSAIEYTVRSCMLKVDLGHLESKNIVIWDCGTDAESSEIAAKLAQDFGLCFANRNEKLEDILSLKLDLH